MRFATYWCPPQPSARLGAGSPGGWAAPAPGTGAQRGLGSGSEQPGDRSCLPCLSLSTGEETRPRRWGAKNASATITKKKRSNKCQPEGKRPKNKKEKKKRKRKLGGKRSEKPGHSLTHRKNSISFGGGETGVPCAAGAGRCCQRRYWGRARSTPAPGAAASPAPRRWAGRAGDEVSGRILQQGRGLGRGKGCGRGSRATPSRCACRADRAQICPVPPLRPQHPTSEHLRTVPVLRCEGEWAGEGKRMNSRLPASSRCGFRQDLGSCHARRLRQVIPLPAQPPANKLPLQRASSSSYDPVNVPGYERIVRVVRTKMMEMGSVKHRAV